jgi:transcriptional regulator with XRE-family HTH domain
MAMLFWCVAKYVVSAYSAYCGDLVPLIARRVGIATRRDGVLIADTTMAIMNNDLAATFSPDLTLRGALGIALRAMVRCRIRIVWLFDVPATVWVRDNMAVWHRSTLLAPCQAQRQRRNPGTPRRGVAGPRLRGLTGRGGEQKVADPFASVNYRNLSSPTTCTDVDYVAHGAQNAGMKNLDERGIYLRIGQELRKQRAQRRLSQARLAEAAGLRRTSLVNIEAGRQRLPLHALYALCDALEIEPIDVLPAIAEVRRPTEADDNEVLVEGQMRRIPPKTAGLVRAVLDDFSDADKGAA